jgi:GNAT superfamily N-acetyltransferase
MNLQSINEPFNDGNTSYPFGINIQQVRSVSDLNSIADKGLIRLYQEAFAEPPYDEIFNDAQVYNIMRDIILSSGFIFTAMSKESLGQIIAFVASVPLTAKANVAEFLGERVNPKAASYFAEDAVDKRFRRRGISAVMKQVLLNANAECGYETMVLRTSADPQNGQLPAVLKAGFLPIPGLFQDVMSMKKDGIERPDRRCFFLYDLQSPKL